MSAKHAPADALLPRWLSCDGSSFGWRKPAAWKTPNLQLSFGM